MTERVYDLSDKLNRRVSSLLEPRTTRSGLLRRTAILGSALAIAPIRYLLEPGSAWAFATTCTSCPVGSGCRQANSTFCCTINGGGNFCPPNSGECGYWLCSSNNMFYVDCCSTGTCTGHCALDTCVNRKTCCNDRFYFNCSYAGATGKVVCRFTTIGYPGSSCGKICGTNYGTGNCDAPPACAQNPPC